METDRVVDWLKLEKDMVELILTRLRAVVDFIRFGAVCKTWHSIYLENRHRLSHPLPILIIPSYEKNEFQHLFNLSKNHSLSLSEKHTYHLKKLSNEEENGKWWCFGTSEGCLIMIDFRLNISLLNPLTKTETPLPPLTSLSDIFTICETGGTTGTGTIEYKRHYRCHLPGMVGWFKKYLFMPKMYVHKAVMAGPYVVAILGYQSGLAFCRRDSDTWTYVGNDWFQFHFEDLVCYNGNFYAVDQSGHVVVIDVSGPHPTMTEVAMAIGGGIEFCRKYLVESFGELLMVGRRVDYLSYPRRTYSFEILRVDVNKHLCFPLETLGDCLLFLGENCSMSLFAQEFSGCERNCIYFVDELGENSCEGYLHVYNVEDGSIEPYYKRDWNWNWLSPWPIWLTPKPW